jgi:multimeric flavodoxin WrbA
MRILGISGGRRMGNSEILVKEALMGAEEQGATVEIVRLMEMNIKPPLGEDMPGVSGDRAPALKRKMSQCDGIILGAPVYCLTAPGYLLNIRDRVSIRHSLPVRPKIGALIAVGGTDWVNLALPTLYLFLPHGHVELVDQMVVPFTSHLGQVVLNDEALARARRLGNNVGKASKMPAAEVDYVGDERWTCPLCRQNLLKVSGKFVECPICDVRGNIQIKGDEINVIFSETDLQKYRWGPDGLKRHAQAMKMSDTIFKKRQTEIKDKLRKYENYEPSSM